VLISKQVIIAITKLLIRHAENIINSYTLKCRSHKPKTIFKQYSLYDIILSPGKYYVRKSKYITNLILAL
jgi:hypothetical protein